MRRGFLAFLLVLAFLPAALELSAIHSMSIAHVEQSKSFMLEQQRVTNMGYDLELSFWRTIEYSMGMSRGQGDEKRRRLLAEDLKRWRDGMLAMHPGSRIWCGEVGLHYENEIYNSGDFDIENYIVIIPSQEGGARETVLIHERGGSESPIAVVAVIEFGGTKAVYLIPGGSSIEL